MNNKPNANRIRIVAGSLKRTFIKVPDLPDLRPTPERVRETLFNWLNHLWQNEFQDKRVLDLFAGSGALGFEAASRGCGQVDLVETNKVAIAILREFKQKHELANISVYHKNALEFIKHNNQYDLIMLDPPFSQDHMQKLKPLITKLCKDSTLIYTETAQVMDWSEEDEQFELVRSGKAGKVFFQLLRLKKAL